MKVFLTGGTGFIGQPLTRRLLARGWEVIALVRKPDSAQARALSKLGAHCVAGDITDRESMRAGMTGADLVVHNAGWYELGLTADAQRRMRAINVDGTEAVLGLAQELGIQRVVYVSSVVALGDTGRQQRDETFVSQSHPPLRLRTNQNRRPPPGAALSAERFAAHHRLPQSGRRPQRPFTVGLLCAPLRQRPDAARGLGQGLHLFSCRCYRCRRRDCAGGGEGPRGRNVFAQR